MYDDELPVDAIEEIEESAIETPSDPEMTVLEEDEVISESDAAPATPDNTFVSLLDDDYEDESLPSLAAELEALTLTPELDDEAAIEATDEGEPQAAQEDTLPTDAEPPTNEDGAAVILPQPETGEALWYVIHCYSGYENKVRSNLGQRIDSMGMNNLIFDVVVPTEEEIEVRDGKRRTVERRVFPGYILVQMVLTEESWYVVRNTPGVTGFVGMGNDPTPLQDKEVSQIIKRMESEAPKIKVGYKIGQRVRINEGPFNDFVGTVGEIDVERAKVRVLVSFFGRETPVELDFLQVERA